MIWGQIPPILLGSGKCCLYTTLKQSFLIWQFMLCSRELVWVLSLTVTVKSRAIVSRMGHLAWSLLVTAAIAGWSSTRPSAFLHLKHQVMSLTCKADNSLLWGTWAVLYWGGDSPWCPHWNKQIDFLLSLEVNLSDVLPITCACILASTK